MDSCDKSVFEQILTYGHGDGTNNFQELVGVRVTRLSPEGGTGELVLDKRHFNPNGTIHGGVLYTLADIVTGHTAIAWGLNATGKGADELACTTVSGSLNFLRQARGSKLTCHATCRKMGKSLAVMDVSILDDRDVEVSAGSFTYYYLDRQRFLQQA